MKLLTDFSWKLKYSSEDGDLTTQFYIPALSCAVAYDRSTGFFSASALALAMRGIERLVRNGGRMRLVVGCTLDPPEIEAIERGEKLRETVERKLYLSSFLPEPTLRTGHLENLARRFRTGVHSCKHCETQVQKSIL